MTTTEVKADGAVAKADKPSKSAVRAGSIRTWSGSWWRRPASRAWS